MRVANIIRILFGLVMLAGAAANAFMALTQPGIYAPFADMSFLSLYRTAWQSLVLPYLGAWLLLVVAFEVTMGVLLLSKGMWVRVGIVGTILFFLFLFPFWWAGGAILTLVFAVILLLLLRYDYEDNIIDILRGGIRE
jgi:hypothetical protein